MDASLPQTDLLFAAVVRGPKAEGQVEPVPAYTWNMMGRFFPPHSMRSLQSMLQSVVEN